MSKLLGSPAGSDGREPGLRTLVVLLCLSAIIVTMYSQEGQNGPIHTLRAGVQVVAAPFAALGSVLEQPFGALRVSLEDATADTETLNELRERNAYLVSQLSMLQEYQAENESLRAMLNLAASTGSSGIACQVIANAQDSWTNTVTLNRGSNDGIKVDMPVTDGNAVIGQVCLVSPTTSTVRLVSDPSYSVSARVQGTQGSGILSGTGDSMLKLEFVPTDQQVSAGDIVVTSGLSDVYPAGLVIGTVASVSSAASDLYYQIVVEPLSTVGNASEAFVITSFVDQARQGDAS